LKAHLRYRAATTFKPWSIAPPLRAPRDGFGW
jgi:hypothetical protein